jgi:hypothetical protein
MQLDWKALWGNFSIDEKSSLIEIIKGYLNDKIAASLTNSWSNPDSMTVP